MGLSILTGSVVNVSVKIRDVSKGSLYFHNEEKLSPDTAEVLPIYFDKPVKLSINSYLIIAVDVTGTEYGRGGELTYVKKLQVSFRGSSDGGRSQVCFNLQKASQNCIISEIYFNNE